MQHAQQPPKHIIAFVQPATAARNILEECTNRFDHDDSIMSIVLRLDTVTIRCSKSKRGKVRASVTAQ